MKNEIIRFFPKHILFSRNLILFVQMVVCENCIFFIAISVICSVVSDSFWSRTSCSGLARYCWNGRSTSSRASATQSSGLPVPPYRSQWATLLGVLQRRLHHAGKHVQKLFRLQLLSIKFYAQQWTQYNSPRIEGITILRMITHRDKNCYKFFFKIKVIGSPGNNGNVR